MPIDLGFSEGGVLGLGWDHLCHTSDGTACGLVYTQRRGGGGGTSVQPAHSLPASPPLNLATFKVPEGYESGGWEGRKCAPERFRFRKRTAGSVELKGGGPHTSIYADFLRAFLGV